MVHRWLMLATVLFPAAAVADVADDARAFLGDRSGRIVMIDKAEGDRAYAFDLDDGRLYPVADDLLVQSPLLSPDGTRITYAQIGKIYIQPLDGGPRTSVADGYEPHWWLDAAGDEWIYYETAGNLTPEQSRGIRWPNAEGIDTRRVRLRDHADEWLLAWKGNGGPSPSGSHIGAGGASMLLFDLTTGQHAQLYGGGFACNPSISPDERHRLMFLASNHQSFVIHDWEDTLVWELPLPAGMSEWNAPEWSNDPDFATVTMRDPTHKGSVHLVRISTGETLLVLDGTTSLHDWMAPHLWVEGVAPYPWPEPEPEPEPEPPEAELGTESARGCAAVAPPMAALLLLRRRRRAAS